MTTRVWPISTVRASTLVLIFAALLFSSQLALAQFSQQGPKLVGTGAVGSANQGWSVGVSADGNTAIVGGPWDNVNGGAGAAWVFTRSGGVWTQQGSKLVGTDGIGALQGYSVALSGDGNTAIVGGPWDNDTAGAAWVFTRSNGVWTQPGSKLVGNDAVGGFVNQGRSVALSGTRARPCGRCTAAGAGLAVGPDLGCAGGGDFLCCVSFRPADMPPHTPQAAMGHITICDRSPLRARQKPFNFSE